MTTIAEQVGRVVGGRYRLLAPVGVGASSQVFAAMDTRLSRRVAVKVLHPMLASDRAFLRRFQAEARLAASLDHPHIMRVFDWGEEDEGPFLVLELLAGGSLRSLLDSGVHLSHSQVASMGAQAASGLAYAHRRGIIHRDIKPGNLLFDDDGHIRIADFGVARALAESARTEPLGAIFGTARYASPEQAEGRPLDDRTDVYSLVLVLYEALTGRVPFSADTISSTLMARVGASLPIVAELGPLAPILAQGAISEPLARLDAAAIQSDLDLLVRELSPPAPLPLVRVGSAPMSPAAKLRADSDPTTEDLAGVAGHEGDRDGYDLSERGGASQAPDDPDDPEVDLPDITLFRVPRPVGDPLPERTVESLAQPVSEGRDDRPGRSGRKVAAWVLAAVVLVAALVGGGFAYEKLVVYNHIVPRLTSLQLGVAENDAKHVGLDTHVASRLWDANVPAGYVISQSVKPGLHEKAGKVIDLSISKGIEPVNVPDLSGDTATAAAAALAQHRLVALPPIKQYSSRVRLGRMISWSDEGKAVKPGTKIELFVSEGPAPRDVPPVPEVDTYTQASKLLQAAGFVPYEATEYTMAAPEGEIVFTSPGPGSGPQSYGSRVEVMVSEGPPYVKIPYLVGDSLSYAKSVLSSEGLNVQAYGPPGFVYATDPSSGSVREGSTVYVYTI